MIDNGNPISERQLAAPLHPTFSDGCWSFSGGSGRKIAKSVIAWLEEHCEIRVRAVVPVVEDGQVVEMLIVPQ